MTDASDSAAEPQAPPAPPAVEATDFEQVLAAIRGIENSTSSWRESLSFLVLSLILFVAASGATAGFGASLFQHLVILIPVLLIHESGHLLAMRAFGYRNVRMFFIPFFGAAVTGRQPHVDGWKKAVVSLGGPLPGIAIGATIGALGMLRASPTLLQISSTFLLINGFNLLPLLPLDGGWVAQSIFGSRLLFVEMALRLAAVAGFGALGFLTGDKILYFLAYLMAVSMLSAYRVGRLAGEFRAQALESASEEGVIPEAAARRIHERVSDTFLMSGPKARARVVLDVFDAVHTKAPGMLASVGLAAIQFGGLVAAVLFAVLFQSGRPNTTPSVDFASPPPFKTTSTEVKWVKQRKPSLAQGTHDVLVAHLGSHETALSQLASLDLESEEVEALVIGSHFFLLFEDLPEVRRRWLDAVKRMDADPFISTPLLPARMSLSCTSDPKSTRTLIDAATASLLLQEGDLPPVWSGEADARGAGEARSNAIATSTRLRDLRSATVSESEARYKEALRSATRAGESADVERLKRKREVDVRETLLGKLNALRADPTVDQGVLTRFIESEKSGSLVGPEAAAAGVASAHLAAIEGFAIDGGSQAIFQLSRFRSLPHGLAALIAWLEDRGCGSIRYSLGPSSDPDDFSE